MKLYKLFFAIIFLLFSSNSFSQSEEIDCKILKNIKLQYFDAPNREDFVLISNNKHVEYHQNGKYFIKSDLVWINDCEYNAILTDFNLPNFPYTIGEIMNVRFYKIEKKVIYGISTIRNNSFEIKFKIVD